MKAWQLLKTKKQWCKEWFARDKNSNECPSRSPAAVSFCITGAIYRCYSRTYSEKLLIRLDREIGNESIGLWNDNPKRKFSDVKGLLKKLDI